MTSLHGHRGLEQQRKGKVLSYKPVADETAPWLSYKPVADESTECSCTAASPVCDQRRGHWAADLEGGWV